MHYIARVIPQKLAHAATLRTPTARMESDSVREHTKINLVLVIVDSSSVSLSKQVVIVVLKKGLF